MKHTPLVMEGRVKLTLEFHRIVGGGFVSYKLTATRDVKDGVFYFPRKDWLKRLARKAGLVGFQEESRFDRVDASFENMKSIYFKCLPASDDDVRVKFLELLMKGRWTK